MRAPRRKDLHDGTSVWAGSAKDLAGDRLTRIAKHDVIVVGAGVSGALSALLFANAGLDVAVIDRRAPTLGSTVASTAMIQFEIDTPLIELRKKIGSAAANRAYLRSAQAVKDLGALVRDHNLVCDWRWRDALYLCGNTMGHRAMVGEVKARQSIGLPSVFLTARDLDLQFGMQRTGAAYSTLAADLNPVSLAVQCLMRAKTLGAALYLGHTVARVEAADVGLSLRTTEGVQLNARRIVFATGYEVVRGMPTRAFDIVSSWAIASKPMASQRFWRNRCLIWEANDPYLYVRTTADGRIVAGGEDSGAASPVRRASAVPTKSRRLAAKVIGLLHLENFEIDYAWAGAFADSPTGLPAFVEIPELRGAYSILGCGGNGITFSVIGAQLALAWLQRRKDADEDLFVWS